MTATHLAHLFPEEDLRAAIDGGYVGVQTHPTLPLVIYNYTPAAQYERVWNPVTTQCRGLIADLDGYIVARPFAKFFNYGEVDQYDGLPDGDFTVSEKMDGSLGIIYTYAGRSAVATRGSFMSEQALWATGYLKNMNYPEGVGFTQPEGVTTLVEIIYPENRIVVDYGDAQGLWLLGATLNRTGQDIDRNKIDWWNGPTAPVFGFDISVDGAVQMAQSNGFADGEGVVLCWPRTDGPSFRLKVKHPRYVELHRIVTGLSTRTVHEALANGTFNDLIANVPDEFHPWVRQAADALADEYTEIEMQAHNDLIEARLHAESLADHAPRDFDYTYSRKDLAEGIKSIAKYPGLCFALEDGKDISPRIWQMIRPERSTAMIIDTDSRGELT